MAFDVAIIPHPMTSFLARVFADRYANHQAIGNNFLLLVMYRFAHPFALAFKRLHLTPNHVTTLSGLSAVAAFAALILCESAIPFALLWGTSLLLDFCDGTVARMTNQVSRSAFRFDHLSDLAKISLIILGAGIRYDDLTMWVLSSAAIFLFMYYSVLNQELKGVRGKLGIAASSSLSATTPEREIRKSFQSRLPFPLRVIYVPLATINGHTLLVFLALPFGPVGAGCALAYLMAVSALGTATRIRQLMLLPKP